MRSKLEAWRAQGADRLAPLRFQHIEALDRRAAAQSGTVRAVLDQRLAELVAAYAQDLERGPVMTEAATGFALEDVARRDRRDSSGPLVALVSALTRGSPANIAAGHSSLAPAGAPGLSVIDEIRQACTKVRNQSQLRQALIPSPADAGPLNSASLVHRALTRMQELSPVYLEHFIAHVDALSALQSSCASALRPVENAARPTGPAKRTRAKARKRTP